eukprot:5110166-Heterocapsa_arctica.AAC.1
MPGLVAVPDTMRKVTRAMVDAHIQKHGVFLRRGRPKSGDADRRAEREAGGEDWKSAGKIEPEDGQSEVRSQVAGGGQEKTRTRTSNLARRKERARTSTFTRK